MKLYQHNIFRLTDNETVIDDTWQFLILAGRSFIWSNFDKFSDQQPFQGVSILFSFFTNLSPFGFMIQTSNFNYSLHFFSEHLGEEYWSDDYDGLVPVVEPTQDNQNPDQSAL
jgi:hypothetical protein